jgi:hypothetical protein
LVTRVCFSPGKTKGEVRKHLEEFAVWVGKTSVLEAVWTREMAEKIRTLKMNLEKGQPEEEIFEPLLRCVVEASSHVHQLLSDIEEQGKIQAVDTPDPNTDGLSMEA